MIRVEDLEGIRGGEGLRIKHQVGSPTGEAGWEQDAFGPGCYGFVADDPTGRFDALVAPQFTPVAMEILPDRRPLPGIESAP